MFTNEIVNAEMQRNRVLLRFENMNARRVAVSSTDWLGVWWGAT